MLKQDTFWKITLEGKNGARHKIELVPTLTNRFILVYNNKKHDKLVTATAITKRIRQIIKR
jgi:hypothetical protein